MRVLALLAAGGALAASPGLFPWEQAVLREPDVFAAAVRREISGTFSPVAACRPFPGEASWPAPSAWELLNSTACGALLRPVPAASVCYRNTSVGAYDQDACTKLEAIWAFGFNKMNHPIEVVSPNFQGLTCIPPTDIDTHGCVQGGFPVYVMNVTTVKQVQAAVNFARETRVRLVIKNTGHDLEGKSLGAGALSIWTHWLKDIELFRSVTIGSYTGPAYKVGAGVQAAQIYDRAEKDGLMVVGGVCNSVGLFGGYSQGGGHSPLGSLYGMGADQILSIQVVTADGQFKTASPTENQDLFWAIRGGGGATFGVVTSMVIKAFPNKRTAVASFDWGVGISNISNDTFWAGVRSYFSHFGEFTDQGLWATFNIYPKGSIFNDGKMRIFVSPFFGVGKTVAELKVLLKPWLDEMAALGINPVTTWTDFDSYLPAYYSQLPADTSTGLQPHNMHYSSRLVPRENFDARGKLNQTVAVYRQLAEADHVFNAFMVAPKVTNGKPVGADGNAVHPAWRNALSHSISFFFWDIKATPAERMATHRAWSREYQAMRDVTPGAGSYLAEGDRLEPNFQQAFYGSNYARLLRIKKQVDPTDVFWVATGVGSEGWVLDTPSGIPTENGKLCKAS